MTTPMVTYEIRGQLTELSPNTTWDDGTGRHLPLDYSVVVTGPGWRLELEHVVSGTPLPAVGGEIRLATDGERFRVAAVAYAERPQDAPTSEEPS